MATIHTPLLTLVGPSPPATPPNVVTPLGRSPPKVERPFNVELCVRTMLNISNKNTIKVGAKLNANALFCCSVVKDREHIFT
jgi:hypothetical protein